MYPCVGVDITTEGVGLSVQVNLGNSPDQHPFRYAMPGPSRLRREYDRLTRLFDDMMNRRRLKPPGNVIDRLKERIEDLDLRIREIDLEAQPGDYGPSRAELKKTERLLQQVQEEIRELARFRVADKGSFLGRLLGYRHV